MILEIIMFVLKVLASILLFAIIITTIVDAVLMLDPFHESFIIIPVIDWFMYDLITYIKAIGKGLLYSIRVIFIICIIIPISLSMHLLGIIAGILINPFMNGYEKSDSIITKIGDKI